MPPRGIFGIPHGVLSSVDEKVAFAIGLLALAAAVGYDVLSDGDLDARPVSGAAGVGVGIALVGSFAAPAAVSNEWHVPVLVVLLVLGGVLLTHRRG